MNMRRKGKITSWNDEKGFGFITPLTDGNRVFVHIKAFGSRRRRPEIDQTVTYTLSADKQGRPCAIKATFPGNRLPRNPKPKTGLLSAFGVAVSFLVLVGISVLTSKVPLWLLATYLFASLFTFAMYAVDKLAAKNRGWRTQESALHLLSLAGGWPGALVAQQKLRHKSRKRSFRAVFWVTVLLNCGTFVWLLTPTGSSALQSLVSLLRWS